MIRSVFMEGVELALLWTKYWRMLVIALLSLITARWLVKYQMY